MIAICTVLLVLSITYFGCFAAATAGPATTTAPAAEVVSVAMRDVQFSPATIEVKAGSVVEWKNDDMVPHTATCSSFDSGSLTSGQSWRHTFTEPGTFHYKCTFHPTMKGVVVVK
jgi:plastocyanin